MVEDKTLEVLLDEICKNILEVNAEIEVARIKREGLEHKLTNLELNELDELGAIVVVDGSVELTTKGERWLYRLQEVRNDHYVVNGDDIPF